MPIYSLNDLKETVTYFLKLSSFTRYHLDEVLPEIITKSGLSLSQELVTECDLLYKSASKLLELNQGSNTNLVSNNSNLSDLKSIEGSSSRNYHSSSFIHNEKPDDPSFSNTTDVVGKSDHITQSSLDIKQPEVAATYPEFCELWENVLNEMYCSLPLVDNQGKYCGLCNFYTFSPVEWNEHFINDATHKTRYSQAQKENVHLTKLQCDFCGIHLYSEEAHLNIIIGSDIHTKLDNEISKIMTISNKTVDLKTPNSTQESNPPSTNSSIKGTKKIYNWRNKTKEQGSRSNTAKTNSFKKLSSESINEGTEIDNAFIELCSKMRTSQCSGYYCQLCKVAFFKSKKWLAHVDQHKQHLDVKIFDCKMCSFQLCGRDERNVYQNYHVKSLHLGALNLVNPQSKSDSSTKSPKPSLNSENRYSPPNSSLVSSNLSSFGKSKIPPTPVAAPTQSDSCNLGDSSNCEADRKSPLEKFLEIIQEKKMYYQKNNMCAFDGFCLNCDIIFKDKFMWLRHMADAHPIQDEFKEVNCDKCKLFMFGAKTNIINNFFSVGAHLEFDSIIDN